MYEHSNVPLTRHNGKLYTMYRTQVNFSDFSRFVEVDVNDVVRDKLKKGIQPTPYDLDNQAKLSKITNETVFTRTQLRHYLARYLPERMCWTGIHPVHNDTRERDTHRYYWASKMAKDFVMLTEKETFDAYEV